MASAGNSVTKSSIISDFISAVMDPAKNSTRLTSSSTLPTTNQQMWENGSIRTSYQEPVYATAYDQYGYAYQYIAYYNTINIVLSCINSGALDSSTSGMDNPTTSNLPSSAIVASEIISTCRSYAYNTTRIRNIQYGLRYTQYGYGQYGGTGVPNSAPPTDIYGTPVYTGDLNPGTSLAHLTSSYLVSLPSSVGSEPAAGNEVKATSLGTFYSNLRFYADAATNGAGTVDLRICHTSCHNNCHSSRGRR